MKKVKCKNCKYRTKYSCSYDNFMSAMYFITKDQVKFWKNEKDKLRDCKHYKKKWYRLT